MHNEYYRAKVDGTVYDKGHELSWGRTNEGKLQYYAIGNKISDQNIKSS